MDWDPFLYSERFESSVIYIFGISNSIYKFHKILGLCQQIHQLMYRQRIILMQFLLRLQGQLRFKTSFDEPACEWAGPAKTIRDPSNTGGLFLLSIRRSPATIVGVETNNDLLRFKSSTIIYFKSLLLELSKPKRPIGVYLVAIVLKNFLVTLQNFH